MTAYDEDLRKKFDDANPQWHSNDGSLEVGVTDIGLYGLRIQDDPATVLVYYQKEWDAFVEGVRDGEFELDTLIATAQQRRRNVEVRHHSGLPIRNATAHSG